MERGQGEEGELGGHVARGVAWVGAGFALTRFLGLVSNLVIAQLIVPRDAGDFTAGAIVLTLGALFADSGTTAALIQWRGDVEKEAASTAVASTVLAGIALAALSAAASPLLALIFDSHRVGEIALAMSGAPLLRSFQIVPDALLQRRFSFARRVAVDPLGVVAFASVAIIACSQGLGPWGLVLGSYSSMLVMSIAAWAFVRWRPSWRSVSFAIWRRLAAFGRHVLASEVIRTGAAQIDTVAIGGVRGTTALGSYSYGYRLATQPTVAWIAVAAYVLFPSFARIGHDLARLTRAVWRATTAMFVVVVPVNLALVAVGPTLVYVLLGPRWHAAGPVVIALGAYGLGMIAQSMAGEVVKSIGQPQLLTRQWLVRVVFLVVFVPALLPFGAVGVAAAVSISAVAMGLYSLNQICGRLDISRAHLAGRLLRILIAGLVATAAGIAVDLLVGPRDHSRGFAAAVLVLEGVTILTVYLAALRLLAAEEFGTALAVVRPPAARVLRRLSRRTRTTSG